MQINRLHDWQMTPREAIAVQRGLASQVCLTGAIRLPRLIAGVDISVDRVEKRGVAAVVVLEYPGLEVVETSRVTGPVDFPYVPGLLSFREIPLLLPAFEKLEHKPDMVMVDGHGYAHPRRIGIGCHLGLFLDLPTIGCAKSRLCGSHEEPGLERGSVAPLIEDSEVIGAAVRTRTGTKPIYVSIGHKISLEQAIFWTMECARYRIPEPTRLAHIAANALPEVALA